MVSLFKLTKYGNIDGHQQHSMIDRKLWHACTKNQYIVEHSIKYDCLVLFPLTLNFALHQQQNQSWNNKQVLKNCINKILLKFILHNFQQIVLFRKCTSKKNSHGAPSWLIP